MKDLPVNTILVGDVRERLRELPDECVQCVVTSPPYWGLRDYGTGKWEGGDSTCKHKVRKDLSKAIATSGLDGGKGNVGNQHEGFKDKCPRCGARRIDRQIGLEKTITEYVDRMVEVFREVRRCLRDDGTLWLNLGDSYAGSGKGAWENTEAQKEVYVPKPGGLESKVDKIPKGLKAKDLVGVPWRVAFALQADGWYLRSDIIWSKPNPMPESITDRPTKAHEYLFLMSKSERYYYDAEAIKEASRYVGSQKSQGRGEFGGKGSPKKGLEPFRAVTESRNRRTVWEIPTSPFPEAHFAVFPPKLVEPCILAGTSEKGYCSDCGKPWIRNTAHEYEKTRPNGSRGIKTLGRQHIQYGSARYKDRLIRHTTTIGWQASCSCKASIEPGVVLDPFMGSGTTALVALKAGRRFIGTELNPEYAKMAEARIWQEKNQRSLL